MQYTGAVFSPLFFMEEPPLMPRDICSPGSQVGRWMRVCCFVALLEREPVESTGGRSASSQQLGPWVNRPQRERTQPPSLLLKKEQVTVLLCIHETLIAVFN